MQDWVLQENSGRPCGSLRVSHSGGMKAGVNFLLLSITGWGLLPNWLYRTSILLRLEKPLWQSVTRVHKEKPQPREFAEIRGGAQGTTVGIWQLPLQYLSATLFHSSPIISRVAPCKRIIMWPINVYIIFTFFKFWEFFLTLRSNVFSKSKRNSQH